MDIRREGFLTDSQVGTGNILSLELHTKDIEALADPRNRYSMKRFGGLLHGRQTVGWGIEDKVHVNLAEPDRGKQLNQPLSISLDPGSDLYYTLWMNDHLATAGLVFQTENIYDVLEHDPSNMLKRLGITVLRCYNLQFLADTLRSTGQL